MLTLFMWNLTFCVAKVEAKFTAYFISVYVKNLYCNQWGFQSEFKTPPPLPPAFVAQNLKQRNNYNFCKNCTKLETYMIFLKIFLDRGPLS